MDFVVAIVACEEWETVQKINKYKSSCKYKWNQINHNHVLSLNFSVFVPFVLPFDSFRCVALRCVDWFLFFLLICSFLVNNVFLFFLHKLIMYATSGCLSVSLLSLSLFLFYLDVFQCTLTLSKSRIYSHNNDLITDILLHFSRQYLNFVIWFLSCCLNFTNLPLNAYQYLWKKIRKKLWKFTVNIEWN